MVEAKMATIGSKMICDSLYELTFSCSLVCLYTFTYDPFLSTINGLSELYILYLVLMWMQIIPLLLRIIDILRYYDTKMLQYSWDNIQANYISLLFKLLKFPLLFVGCIIFGYTVNITECVYLTSSTTSSTCISLWFISISSLIGIPLGTCIYLIDGVFLCRYLCKIKVCPICIDALISEIVLLPCNHEYHIECIKTWNKCPLCDKAIPLV